MNTRIVVVLGMHRSGTSAISNTIDSLGLNFGDNLYGPREDNPAGFWENESLVQFNDALLAEVGMRWDSLGLIDKKLWDDSIWDQWVDNATTLLNEEFPGTHTYGMKDPRLSKLMGFWQKVFKRCQYDVKYIVALRNPLEVIASLKKRDGFDAIKSQLLWFEYTLSALQDTDNQNRLLVSYNDLMRNPEGIIDALADYLSDVMGGEKCVKEIPVGVLKPEYRHTLYSSEELANSSDVFGLVTELYLVALEYVRKECNRDKFSMVTDKVLSCYSALSLPLIYSMLLDHDENRRPRKRSRYKLFVDFIKGTKSE